MSGMRFFLFLTRPICPICHAPLFPARFPHISPGTCSFSQAIKNALWQNLAFILILVGGLLSGALFLYLSCRFCFVCPLYRKRLEEKRHREMNVGQRM